MKKSMLNVITLALVLINLVLTVLLTFSLVSTNNRTNNLIKKVDSKNLVAQTYKAKTSNIMKVLDRYEELNRNV